MNRMYHFNMKDIWLRIGSILILGTIIWHLISYVNGIFNEEAYEPFNRFFLAIVTTVLTLTIIQIALKFDKISWKDLGMSSFKTNCFTFLLGILIFAIPATIGLIICLMLGWVEIEVHTSWNQLFLSVIILCMTVFLMEALPEELIFRGYVYRYVNILFPHWGTIILQALLFSIFAYLIGAMYSTEQIQFLPGFAIILGIFRAISGNVWTSIGFHVAMMTTTQILSPFHGHFDVTGLFTLRFFAFILLPSMIGAIVLSFIYANFKWSKKESLHKG